MAKQAKELVSMRAYIMCMARGPRVDLSKPHAVYSAVLKLQQICVKNIACKCTVVLCRNYAQVEFS